MTKLQDFVESKLASAAANQKKAYDKSSTQQSFKVHDLVIEPHCRKATGKSLQQKGRLMSKFQMEKGQGLSILIDYNIAFYHHQILYHPRQH